MTGFIALVDNALLVDIIPITSIWPFRRVCRATWSAIKPYVIALRFAATRLNVSSLQLTLGKWFEVWNACALVVEKCGIDASVWAYAIEWEGSRVAELGLEDVHASPWPFEVPFLYMWHPDDLRSLNEVHSSVAWILSLTGCFCCRCDDIEEVELDAFVILSNGQFALISGMWQRSDDEGEAYVITSIRVENTVAAALSDDWYVDLGGRFRAYCNYRFWSQPSEMIRTLWACWVAQGAVRRYARDGIAYDQECFWEWYVEEFMSDSDNVGSEEFGIDLFQRRWEEAAPCNTKADQFAGMICDQRLERTMEFARLRL